MYLEMYLYASATAMKKMRFLTVVRRNKALQLYQT